jgi:hypothetical protein
MRCLCPHCFALVVRAGRPGDLNYCPNCRRMFLCPAARKVPPWILGVLVVLATNSWLMCSS